MYRRARDSRMPARRSQCDGGFGLVELVVAMVLLGIIMAVAFPLYKKSIDRSKASATRNNLAQLSAIEIKVRNTEETSLGSVFVDPELSAWTSYLSTDAACSSLPVLPKVSSPGFLASACGQAWDAQAGIIAMVFTGSKISSLEPTFASTKSDIKQQMIDGWGRPLLYHVQDGSPASVATCRSNDYIYSRGKNGDANALNQSDPKLIYVEVSHWSFTRC